MAKVVICGNYGATNLGDEAILEGILSMVRRSIPAAEITVMSANPRETVALHGVKSVPLVPAGFRSLMKGIMRGTIRKTFNAVRDADLFLLGGGGLFTDEKPMAVVIWALQARLARWYKVPVFCIGQSVGPLRTFFGQHMTMRVFRRAARATVRDKQSFTLVQRMGIDDVEELADPAFALASVGPLAERREPYIVMSLRPWIKGDTEHLYTNVVQFVDWLYKRHKLRTILVPFQISGDNDIAVLSKIVDQVRVRKAAELYDYTSDYRRVMELMARSTAVVGMRLHSLIFSSLTHTPFIGLSYSDKVRQFARQIAMEEYILDWTSLDTEKLQSYFDVLLENREKLVRKLDEQVILQRAKAFQHEKLLRAFTT